MECDRGTMYGGLSKGVLYMNGIARSVREELCRGTMYRGTIQGGHRYGVSHRNYVGRTIYGVTINIGHKYGVSDR